jgi:hypothetical protein
MQQPGVALSMHPRDVADHGQDDDKTEQIEKGA